VGLERCPLSPVRIIEELRERTVAAPGFVALKVTLTSPTNGGRTVAIVRWRTKPWSFFIPIIVNVPIEELTYPQGFSVSVDHVLERCLRTELSCMSDVSKNPYICTRSQLSMLDQHYRIQVPGGKQS
jgi:hypothetical protein